MRSCHDVSNLLLAFDGCVCQLVCISTFPYKSGRTRNIPDPGYDVIRVLFWVLVCQRVRCCPAGQVGVVHPRPEVLPWKSGEALLFLAVEAVAVCASRRAVQPLSESRIVITFKNSSHVVGDHTYTAKIIIYMILRLHRTVLFHNSSRREPRAL